MSICMRCGSNCTCDRHGTVPEELFYICCKQLKYPADHKGLCMERIRQVLDDHVQYKMQRRRYEDEQVNAINVLKGAIRQYRHSHGAGFVAGYDREATEEIVTRLLNGGGRDERQIGG